MFDVISNMTIRSIAVCGQVVKHSPSILQEVSKWYKAVQINELLPEQLTNYAAFTMQQGHFLY